jgi:hypothetical protein
MAIGIVFIQQGMTIGDISFKDETNFEIKNPALVILRQADVYLAPVLGVVLEDTLKMSLEDIHFKQVFTPQQELENHYRQIYGSGIVLANSL